MPALRLRMITKEALKVTKRRPRRPRYVIRGLPLRVDPAFHFCRWYLILNAFIGLNGILALHLMSHLLRLGVVTLKRNSVFCDQCLGRFTAGPTCPVGTNFLCSPFFVHTSGVGTARGWQHVKDRWCFEISWCIALTCQCEEALEGSCLEGVSLKVGEGPGST